MINKKTNRISRTARWLVVVGGSMLANATCQTPPENANSFFGIAIARAAELAPADLPADAVVTDAAAAR